MKNIVDPMKFINPELREKLVMIDNMMGGGAMNLTAEMLPLAREHAEKYARPLLPNPVPQKRMIPGGNEAPDVRVYVIGATSGTARSAVLYLHGGGFIMKSAKSDLFNAQKNALNHDCVVVSVDYRLAPDTPFPGALEDNYAALQWLYVNADELGVDRTRIVVVG